MRKTAFLALFVFLLFSIKLKAQDSTTFLVLETRWSHEVYGAYIYFPNDSIHYKALYESPPQNKSKFVDHSKRHILLVNEITKIINELSRDGWLLNTVIHEQEYSLWRTYYFEKRISVND